MGVEYEILMRLMSKLFLNTATILLSFQISSFLLPWLIVLWLSYNAQMEDVGQFGFILAILSPICLLLASPSRNYLLSSEGINFKDVVNFRKILALFGLVVAVFIGYLIESLMFVTVIYMAKISELFFDLDIVTNIKNRNNKSLLKTSLLKWTCILVVFVFSFFITELWLLLLVTALLFLLASIGKQVFEKIYVKEFTTLLKASLPLSISALVFSVYFNIPRYVLGEANADTLLAVFTISSFLIMGGLVVVNTIMQSRLHFMTCQFQKKNFPHLFQNVVFTIIVVLLVYLAIQVLRVDYLSSLFWQAHNNLNEGLPIYDIAYQGVLSMSWGPLLFSYGNYYLIMIGKHKTLLYLALINSIITYPSSMYAYDVGGFDALLWSFNISGLLQFLLIAFLVYKQKVAR